MQDCKSKTNVLLMHDHLGWNGTVMHGPARSFSRWMPVFNHDKYNVTLCILRKKDALSEYFEKRGIRIICLGKHKYDPSTLWSLVRLIRQENIHVMHVQGYGAITFARLARILTGVPVLVHFRDMHSHYPLVQRLSDLMLARFTDGALAISKSVRDFWIKNGSLRGMDHNKLTVLYNSVPLEDFKSPTPEQIAAEKSHLGIEPNAKVVGTVTRLYPQKGNDYFLEAAAEILQVFPKTTFLIVGDGPLRKDLEDLARKLGIHEHIIITGFCDNVAQLLATFDVKVFASWRDDGGSPLPVLEAMAMGKPIVTIKTMVEILEDEVTGLLVPPCDSKAIAQSVIRLLSDENLVKRLGHNAKEASKKHDVHIYVRKLEKTYDDLIGKYL